jgi:hypothetical protein
MGITRTIEICALNVAMHNPHSPQRYVDLFRDSYEQKDLIQQGELHGLLLGALYGTTNWESHGIISGEIYRFVKIDANEPWFNTRTAKQATTQDVEAISIPNHLLAHFQRIPFIFIPNSHEFWFVAKDRKNALGAHAAERYLQQLFDRTSQSKQYPIISVNTLPDAETLDKLLSMHHLQKLTIEVFRPNHDDGSSAEERLMKRMENMNVKSVSQQFIAATDDGIKPDSDLRESAEIAAKTKNVTGIGKNVDGVTEIISTAEKPLRQFLNLNEALETVFDVLKRVAKRS